MRNSNSIINCAMLLSLGYIHEATTYAESCGGGGSPGSGWGRDKDEDDDHWWRRCIAVSAAMMRPVKYRMRRGRWYETTIMTDKCERFCSFTLICLAILKHEKWIMYILKWNCQWNRSIILILIIPCYFQANSVIVTFAKRHDFLSIWLRIDDIIRAKEPWFAT